MNDIEWAKREINIVCKKDFSEYLEEEFDYETECYKTVLKAFVDICENKYLHSGKQFMKHTLNRLLDGKPLSPIEDVDDIWNVIMDHNGYIVYQCNRMESLFKHVYPNGDVKYKDKNYYYCVDIYNNNDRYTLSIVEDIVYELFPITMPYLPLGPIVLYCSVVKDTIDVLYAIKPSGEQVNICRYFKAISDAPNQKFIEITNKNEEG